MTPYRLFSRSNLGIIASAVFLCAISFPAFAARIECPNQLIGQLTSTNTSPLAYAGCHTNFTTVESRKSYWGLAAGNLSNNPQSASFNAFGGVYPPSPAPTERYDTGPVVGRLITVQDMGPSYTGDCSEVRASTAQTSVYPGRWVCGTYFAENFEGVQTGVNVYAKAFWTGTGWTNSTVWYEPPPSVPDAVTQVSATAGNGQAEVAFSPPENDGGSTITGYIITTSPGGQTTNCAESPCTVTGLTNGVSYTFTVMATNAIGNSVPSSSSNSVTPATVPDPPTNISAEAGDGSATVSFTPPVDNGGSAIIGYKVTSGPGGITAECESSPCTIDGLTNGTTYTFEVVAINAVGDSESSEASNAVTPAEPTVPDPPTDVSASPYDEEATILFSPPVNNGGSPITGYSIITGPGGQTTSCAESPCVVTGLNNGTSYTFTVVATNAVGDSLPSEASNSVTPGPDSDGDGTLDIDDAFPNDPIENLDDDNDGIGNKGDAGGFNRGIRIKSYDSLAIDCDIDVAGVSTTTYGLDTPPGTPPGMPLPDQYEFQLNNCGTTVVIEAVFEKTIPLGSVAYLVSPQGEWTILENAIINGNTITYTIIDDGEGDENKTSAIILSRITAVYFTPAVPVPALPLVGLLALIGFVGWFGLRSLP